MDELVKFETVLPDKNIIAVEKWNRGVKNGHHCPCPKHRKMSADLTIPLLTVFDNEIYKICNYKCFICRESNEKRSSHLCDSCKLKHNPTVNKMIPELLSVLDLPELDFVNMLDRTGGDLFKIKPIGEFETEVFNYIATIVCKKAESEAELFDHKHKGNCLKKYCSCDNCKYENWYYHKDTPTCYNSELEPICRMFRIGGRRQW